MNEEEFHQDHKRTLELERAASRVLGVGDGASAPEIKRAWRAKCRETHPDLNPGDPEAERKFRLVNCAYDLLTGGALCDELSALAAEHEPSPADGKYDLSNPWGLYLWWRERFF